MAIIRKKIENLKPGKEYILTVRTKDNNTNAAAPVSGTVRFSVPEDQTVPGGVSGLSLYASLQNVMFVFDPSPDPDLDKYEYELYDNILMTGSPLTGFNAANVFTVAVDNLYAPVEEGTGLKVFYGRVRAIDTTGNTGPWSILVASSGDAPLLDDQYIGSLTASKITAGTIGAHTITLSGANSILKSSNYSAGVSGWQIDGDGNAEFAVADIRGDIIGGTISIGATPNGGFYVDSSGNMWIGSSTFGGADFSVTAGGSVFARAITVVNPVVQGGNFTGGSMSGIDMVNGTISIANKFFVDTNGNLWSGAATYGAATFKVSSAGALEATSGKIANWTIATNSLTAGTGSNQVGIDSGGTNPAFYAGSSGTPGAAKFRVTQAGALVATEATVTGSITATSGSFTGNVLVGTATNKITIAATGTDTSTAIYSGSTTYGSGTGFWLDASGRFSLGNSLTYTSGTLSVNRITATAGTIGTWAIGGSALTAGTGSNQVGVDAGGTNPAFYAGSSGNPATAKFRVTQAGALTATDANITGAITATSGSFTGTITATDGSFTGTVNATSGSFTGNILVGTAVNKITIAATGTDTTTAIYSGSTTYGAGTGFWLDASGRFSLGNSLTYSSGTLSVNRITATTGTIGAWSIGQNALTAGIGSNQVGIDASGGATPAFYAGSSGIPAQAKFRVTQAGILTATEAVVSGTITATGGSFTGNILVGTGTNKITIAATGTDSSTAIYSGSTTYGSGSGFWLDATGRFSLGGSLTYSGGVLSVNRITANDGTIGAWLIGASALTAGVGSNQVGVDASGGATPAFYAGSSGNPLSAKFRVTQDGTLTATGAVISGAITATSGSFTGSITATSGAFTGNVLVGTATNKITIAATSTDTTTAIYSGSATYGAGTGFWLDASGRFSLGSSLTYSSGTLSVNRITANDGSIGSWLISQNRLTAGSGSSQVGIDASGGATPAFYAGSSGVPTQAKFRVTQDGAMTATSGSIASWTINDTSLSATSNNIVLSSAGDVTVGSGNDVARLSGTAATDPYRIWIGHATPASAPFSVTKIGSLTANQGTVAGWTINSEEIFKGSGSSKIALNASANPKIYVGIGTHSSIDTPFYADSSGKFSLGNQIVYNPADGTPDDFGELTVAGKIRGIIESVAPIPSNKLQVSITAVNVTSSTSATVTTASHAFLTNEYVIIEGLTGNASAVNGVRQITVVSGTQFTVSVTGATISNTTGITGATASLREVTLGLHPSEGTGTFVRSAGIGLRLDKYNWWMTNNQFRVGSSGTYFKWNGSRFEISGDSVTGRKLAMGVGGGAADNYFAITEGATPTWNSNDTPFIADARGYFSLGQALTWNGSTLNVVGNISGSAISGGTIDIGGFDTSSFHVDANGNIWSGAATFNTSTNKFAVTSGGILYAQEANISGVITATSGTFSGTVNASAGNFSGTVTVGNYTGDKINIRATTLTTTTAIFAGTGDYSAMTTGFYMDASGRFKLGNKLSWDGTTLTINGNGTFTGDITGASGTFSGAISGSTIDIGGADTTSFHIDSTGNMWLGAAAFNVTTNPFAVTAGGLLYARGADISGAITATSGNFTGTVTVGTDPLVANRITIIGTSTNTSTAIYSGSTTYGAGTGFWLDASGRFSLGSALTYSGGTLAVNRITATDGTIGGWAIGANALTAGTGSNQVGITTTGGATPAFYAGSSGTHTSAKFMVTQAGVLTATEANITGVVNASGGNFTGNVTIGTNATLTNRITIKPGSTAADTAIYSGIGTHNTTTTGFYMDAAGKFSLGQSLVWDGAGSLTVNGGGTFTGSVSGGSIDIGGADSSSFHVNNSGDMWLGAATFNTSTNPFAVTSAGVLYARGANISGAITGSTIDIANAATPSLSFHVDANGNIWSGKTTYADATNATTGTFAVSNTGQLFAIAANISGTITATSGEFTGTVNASGGNFTGTVTIGTDATLSNRITIKPASTAAATAIYTGANDTYATATGFYVDASGRFKLGNGLSWDGNNLSINGSGTFSGALSSASGSFTGALSGGTIDIGGADSTSFHVDSTGNLWMGSATYSDTSPFRISSTGTLRAYGASTVAGQYGAISINPSDANYFGFPSITFDGSAVFAAIESKNGQLLLAAQTNLFLSSATEVRVTVGSATTYFNTGNVTVRAPLYIQAIINNQAVTTITLDNDDGYINADTIAADVSVSAPTFYANGGSSNGYRFAGGAAIYSSSGLKWFNGSAESTIWHSGNMGAGSGLNADTVDGKHASDFALAGHSHSSQRYKTNIEPLSDKAIDHKKLLDLRVVQFNYKDDYLDPNISRFKKILPGFIAEEINELYPVATEYHRDDPEKIETWTPHYLIPPMLKLIQDLYKRIDELESKLEK